jgi:hypothetical protein
MAIYPLQSNYIIDVDIITTTAFKAGMVLMRDDNGRAIPADNSTLLYKTIYQKAGKHLGFASSDHDVSGLTIVEPDVVGSSWLDSNRIFQRYENSDIVHTRRFIAEHLDPTYDVSNPSNRSVVAKRGIGVYNQPGELYSTDQFIPVLHGDFGQDFTDIQTINPGDLLTVGSGVNAGKMVKVNVNSIGTDIIVVGVVDRYDTNSGLLYFKNAFYSVTFSSSSAVMALDAGNSLSFPNTGSIGTVCGITLNEGNQMTLTAPAGHVFDKVLFASYGTPDGVCGSFTIGSCHASTSQSAVEAILLGNNSGIITQGPGTVGMDPCGGVVKRFYVQARFAPTLAKDLTVNNNSGTLTNGVTYDTAGGGSWAFDGTNDFITIPITNYTLNLASVTVFCWVNLALPAKGTLFHLGPFNKGITMGVGIVDNMTLGTKVTLLYSGVVYVSSSYDFGTYSNGWNFVAISFDSSKYPTVYLNNNAGVYVSNNSFSVPNSNIVTIGKELDGTGIRYLTGKMADIRMYSRALSASEILAYYNYTKSRYGL